MTRHSMRTSFFSSCGPTLVRFLMKLLLVPLELSPLISSPGLAPLSELLAEPAFGLVDSEWHDCAQQISEVASVLGRRFAVDDCLPVVHCFWHFVQMCECSTKHNVTMCQCASQIMRRSWVTSSPFEYSSRESHTSSMTRHSICI